jgi:lantibiotic transport system permease protein
MSDFKRAISAEWLKLKRTLALRLAIGAPLAVVVLNFILYSQRPDAAGDGLNPLIGFAQINLTMWTIVVLPMYAALAAALVASMEHQGDLWKHLFALPVSRRAIFAAKWMAAVGLVLLSSLVLAAACA